MKFIQRSLSDAALPRTLFVLSTNTQSVLAGNNTIITMMHGDVAFQNWGKIGDTKPQDSLSFLADVALLAEEFPSFVENSRKSLIFSDESSGDSEKYHEDNDNNLTLENIRSNFEIERILLPGRNEVHNDRFYKGTENGKEDSPDRAINSFDTKSDGYILSIRTIPNLHSSDSLNALLEATPFNTTHTSQRILAETFTGEKSPNKTSISSFLINVPPSDQGKSCTKLPCADRHSKIFSLDAIPLPLIEHSNKRLNISTVTQTKKIQLNYSHQVTIPQDTSNASAFQQSKFDIFEDGRHNLADSRAIPAGLKIKEEVGVESPGEEQPAGDRLSLFRKSRGGDRLSEDRPLVFRESPGGKQPAGDQPSVFIEPPGGVRPAGDRPSVFRESFVCSDCGRAYSTSSNLARHR